MVGTTKSWVGQPAVYTVTNRKQGKKSLRKQSWGYSAYNSNGATQAHAYWMTIMKSMSIHVHRKGQRYKQMCHEMCRIKWRWWIKPCTVSEIGKLLPWNAMSIRRQILYYAALIFQKTIKSTFPFNIAGSSIHLPETSLMLRCAAISKAMTVLADSYPLHYSTENFVQLAEYMFTFFSQKGKVLKTGKWT